MEGCAVGVQFYQAVKALERNDDQGNQEALQIVTGNHDIVKFKDERPKSGEDGYIDARFEYRYRKQPREGFTLLHYAVLYNHVEMMKELIKNGADVSAVNTSDESTALHFACMFGEEETVKTFIRVMKEEKIDVKKVVNKRNERSWSALYYAGERKAENMVKLLLENGADPTSLDKMERTTLLFFSAFSSPECVNSILQYKGESRVDIDHQDCEGSTALHIACKKNREAIASLLLDNGADPTIASSPPEITTDGSTFQTDEITPLHMAMQKCAVECVYLLLESPKLNFKFSQSLIEEAVAINEPKIVLKLLEKLDPTYTLKGSTLLHEVVKSEAYSDEQFRRAVILFGKNCIEYEDEEGRTPLMLAAMLNKHKVLSILQNTYLDILQENFFFPHWPECEEIFRNLIVKQDKNGDSAVHLAVKHDGLDVDFEQTIKVLDQLRSAKSVCKVTALKDEKDRDPLTLRNKDKLTGIHVALKSGRAERATMLLRVSQGRGADLVALDDMSSTIIHYAIQHKISAVEFEKILQLMKQFNSPALFMMLKAKNAQEKTALHMALESKLSQHAEHMLKQAKGVDSDHDDSFINVRDGKNKIALQISIESDCPSDLIKKLLDCQSEVHGHVPIDPKVPLSNVRAVLESEQGGLNVTDGGDHGASLLKAAIEAKRPDIIKYLLVKKAKVSHTHFKQVIFDHENKEFAKLLVRHADNAEDLIKELNKIEEKSGKVFFHKLIENMPDVAEEALYRCNGSQDDSLLEGPHSVAVSENELEMGAESVQKCSPVAKSTLEVMVKHERLTLLQHPVVHKFIESKWNNFGLPLYIFQLILYFFFIIPLSILVLLPVSFAQYNGTSTNASDVTGYDIASYSLAAVVLLFAIIHLMIPLISGIILLSFHHKSEMCSDLLKDYFVPIKKKISLYFQLFVFGLAIIFSILTIANATNACCTVVQWHFGLLAITFGWINLIRLFSKFPFVGEHAITFATIVLTFLKLALFALLLILASTIVLMMVFFNAQALQSPFISFRRGFVTVLTMVTGELGYQEAFGLSYNIDDTDVTTNIEYPETANFVWVIFLVLIPILLTNMLTGLAVGDIIELQKHAALTKLEQKVKLITRVEQYNFCKNEKLKNSEILSKCVSCLKILSKLWNGESETCGDDNSYSKKRDEERKDIESSGGDSKQDTMRIVEGIDDVKNIALSCEKSIREFKDVYDDTINKLKNENAKIRRDNEQLMSEVRKLQQPTATRS